MSGSTSILESPESTPVKWQSNNGSFCLNYSFLNLAGDKLTGEQRVVLEYKGLVTCNVNTMLTFCLMC